MEQKNQNQKPKTSQKMDLPFGGKGRSEFGAWIYDHRVGVSVTVIVYLLAAIVFVSTRILVNKPGGMFTFIEVVDQEKEQPKPEEVKPEEPKEIEKLMEQQHNEKVQNISVNAEAKLNAGLKDDRGTKAADLYKEAAALQDKLNANKNMLEKGLKDEEAIMNSRKPKTEQKQGDNNKREDQLVKGNVTVSFTLSGRTAVTMPVPAYQCEGGGTVVVEITVNRNGKVINASVGKATSTSEQCIIDMSLKAAKNSRFNVDASAEENQRGVITYMFVPQ